MDESQHAPDPQRSVGTPDPVGVIFDMDGVLVDSFPAHLESWRRLAAETGATVTEAGFAATFGRTSRDILRELFGATDEAHIRRLDDRKEAIYRDLIRGRVPAMPGARGLVETCHRSGFRLAVGSSGPCENIRLVCETMDLGRFFDAIVSGEDIERGKPDPQVFLLAADRLGVPPHRCVVIEDAPAGVAAARAAGMACIGVHGGLPPQRLAHADFVVENLAALDAARIESCLRR